MAKKPAAPTQSEIEEIPPEMDYAQHQATWRAFTELVKWSIIGLAIIVVSLYCFIIANQPILGAVLLLALPVGAVALLVTRSRSAA